jgi:hypothetical protein
MQNESVVVEFWAGNPRNNLMVNIYIQYLVALPNSTEVLL